MKGLGKGNETYIVELSEQEWEALLGLAGLDYWGRVPTSIDTDLGPILKKLSNTSLSRIIGMLRHAADYLEKEDTDA